MNKKYLNIGLICSLLFIWGYVGFQFFEYNSGEEYVLPTSSPIIPLEKEAEQNKYVLLSIGQTNRPFGKVYAARTKKPIVKKVKKKPKIKKEEPKKAPIIWPDIKYTGVMSNHGKFLALVHIEQVDKMINEGDFFRGIKFEKVTLDSLQVTYEKETKTIYK